MIKSPFKSALRTLVIIDGHHINTLARKFNMNLEFQVFRTLLDQSPILCSPKYYTTMAIGSDGEPKTNVASLISWLSFNRYDTVTQNVYQVNSVDQRDIKFTPSHISMNMCIDALTLYSEQGYSRLLICSGNREIVPIIQWLRKVGVQIDVISSLELDAVSQEVRSNCDNFYEFTEIAHMFDKAEDSKEVKEE